MNSDAPSETQRRAFGTVFPITRRGRLRWLAKWREGPRVRKERWFDSEKLAEAFLEGQEQLVAGRAPTKVIDGILKYEVKSHFRAFPGDAQPPRKPRGL